MIRGAKLRRLVEQQYAPGGGRALGFDAQWRGLLGLVEGDDGEPTVDRARRGVGPGEVALDEVAWEFFGKRDVLEGVREAFSYTPAQMKRLRLQEAEGNVVLPSHFSNISAFVATIAGLIEIMTLEAYESPEFIGDQFVETMPARVNGGRAIGVRIDGQLNPASLLDGEPYPAVGLAETWVTVPENERYGNVIQLNEKVFIYDRTEQVQESASMAGMAVARKRELRIADMVQGITNTYSREGSASNTYRLTAGAAPNNYVNESVNPITTLDDLDEAMLVLGANVDPNSGWEIAIRPENAILLVTPMKMLKVSQIVRATTVERRTSDSTTIWMGSNPITSYNMAASWIWYNRLIASGLSQTLALERYYLGDFKRAFKYRQIIPFETAQATLSSEDQRRDIIGIWVAREHGVPYTVEPRYVYRGLNTADPGTLSLPGAAPQALPEPANAHRHAEEAHVARSKR